MTTHNDTQTSVDKFIYQMINDFPKISPILKIEVIHELMASLTDEQRLEILNEYCKSCGCELGKIQNHRCFCMDDE